MAHILNTKKQRHVFWSEKIKAHGVKGGNVELPPGETHVPDDVLKEIQSNNPFFKGMLDSGELVIKQDKSVAKAEAQAIADKAKADAEALKTREKAEAKAKEEAAIAEKKAKDELKNLLSDLGMDKRSLNGKSVEELQALVEKLNKETQG